MAQSQIIKEYILWVDFLETLYIKQGYALKNWVEGVSDEAFYPWESPKKNRFV